MAKLYDIILRKIKTKEYYTTPELREELHKIRLSKKDARELERDLVFIGGLNRKTRQKIKKSK